MKQRDLHIRSLTKVFETAEGPVTAVQDVDLDMIGDEFFSLLGPSGCGKTTTLRMIAGLETVTSGSIEFGGRDLAGLASAERNLGMVFQSYALFPHMNVFENAAYGLRIRKVAPKDVTERVHRLLDALGLEGLQNRFPSDLSGGQQQRVSIARALAYDPDMFLLDEPLANLDAKLRVQMREEIRRIQKELGVLAVYVTHDQEEAMSVSDRIGVFRLGRLMQVGSPPEIYRHPTSLFVADFIGKIAFFPGEVVAADARGGRVRLRSGVETEVRRIQPLDAGERTEFGVDAGAVVAVRPEHIRLQRADDPDAVGPEGTVRRELFLGSIVRYFITCPDATREVMVETADAPADIHEGDLVRLNLRVDHATCFRS
jgi:iron(III) transport system ATP-binding protein